jgi:hypothetical protein
MKFLILGLTVFLFASTLPGCGSMDRRGSRPQELSPVESRKEEIINRLIPEDGLTFTRRARLIDATMTVHRKADREELTNLNRLRETLRATSLQDLEKIEADYKERLANAE